MDASPASSASVFVAKPSSSETKLANPFRCLMQRRGLLPSYVGVETFFHCRGLNRSGPGNKVLNRCSAGGCALCACLLCSTESACCLGKTLGGPGRLLGAGAGKRASILA